MAKQTINVGSADLAGDGESIRNAFTKVNSNFTEVYTQVPLATTATYTQSFNTSTLVRAAVSATNIVNGTWTLALSTAGSILINNVAFVSGGFATTSTLVNNLARVSLGSNGYITLANGAQLYDYGSTSSNGYGITDSVGETYIGYDPGDTLGALHMDSYNGKNIRIRTTPVGTNNYKDWLFSSDGSLTLPAGSSIADTSGNAVIGSNSGTVSITNLEVMNFTQLAPSNYLWITNQYYSGSLLTSTFTNRTGTATGTTRVVTGVTQLSTSGVGTGAMFQVTIYYDGNSVTYTAVSIDYNGGNQQYGTGYAVGDTVTIAGASLGGTTPTNNLTFTIGNAVRNNYPAALDGGIIYDYSSKHFLAYNGATWTQLDNPLTPSGTKASNAYGVAGQTSYDSTYFYVCIATNTWRRVALGSTY